MQPAEVAASPGALSFRFSILDVTARGWSAQCTLEEAPDDPVRIQLQGGIAGDSELKKGGVLAERQQQDILEVELF